MDTLIPGLVSRYGVTQETLNSYNQRRGLPIEDVAKVDPKKVKQLYYDMFYKEPGYDQLPPKVANQVFDFGVQSGPSRSTRFLQVLVGAKPDGKLGPKTIASVNDFVALHGEDSLSTSIVNARRQYVENLIKSQPKKFGKIAKGLRNRVNSMEE